MQSTSRHGADPHFLLTVRQTVKYYGPDVNSAVLNDLEPGTLYKARVTPLHGHLFGTHGSDEEMTGAWPWTVVQRHAYVYLFSAWKQVSHNLPAQRFQQTICWSDVLQPPVVRISNTSLSTIHASWDVINYPATSWTAVIYSEDYDTETVYALREWCDENPCCSYFCRDSMTSSYIMSTETQLLFWCRWWTLLEKKRRKSLLICCLPRNISCKSKVTWQKMVMWLIVPKVLPTQVQVSC